MMGILTGASVMQPLSILSRAADLHGVTDRMPVIFFGHGSPMNAIEKNEFSETWKDLGRKIEKPTAILCISAHWETAGTYVTAMDQPRTIHDFGGFPKELYAIKYPAPGNPTLAEKIKSGIQSTNIGLDMSWGLDHGCWSVIKHLYPEADVPVLQMSIDYTKGPEYHFALAKELASLRRKGVMIVGSGNIVHNLSMVAWDKMDISGYAYDWATEANNKMKSSILSGDYKPLLEYNKQGQAFRLAIPTPEHFIPLLYILALKESDENPFLFNDVAMMGSLTMTSVLIR
ncbi:MAG: 4,5-DOPA dioxygenase extradiol [Candidatus Parvibacillus calidus]|nr:MAG: 4,5-DOPA dioxygenase extradiol [Candidatus Parvibacillus calidus]